MEAADVMDNELSATATFAAHSRLSGSASAGRPVQPVRAPSQLMISHYAPHILHLPFSPSPLSTRSSFIQRWKRPCRPHTPAPKHAGRAPRTHGRVEQRAAGLLRRPERALHVMCGKDAWSNAAILSGLCSASAAEKKNARTGYADVRSAVASGAPRRTVAAQHRGEVRGRQAYASSGTSDVPSVRVRMEVRTPSGS
ncbi:hypothetical protein DFH11DRAFT_1732984 [Phellopilus nigrolimitatus]|nr:hypothetical protein DFH11DRAFT_1732984 [Phellopilus nigrolimitatus]